MSSENREESSSGCRLRWQVDPETGFKFIIDELTPACREHLEKMGRKLGPHSKKYLAKRIETSNPEVREALKETGLTHQ